MTDTLLDRPDSAIDRVAPIARKGRGAVSNPAGRFEPARTEAVDDGWGGRGRTGALPEDGDKDGDDLPPLATTVTNEACRTAITRNESPDLPFDRSINPYRGCEHGCVYCFARPSHGYMNLSSGLDFETKLFAKPEIAQRLRAELARPGYKPQPIAMGTNTDPYQPIEKRLRLTRAVLELLAEARHPVAITTKSHLVTRDADILGPMGRERRAVVILSVTTLDGDLARKLEPRASAPRRRLDAIRQLAAAGVPVGVSVAPIIPGLNDHEIEPILQAAKEAGASLAQYALLRLPHEVKDLMTEWLRAHAPNRADRVLSLVREVHGGKLYDSAFGKRMGGQGPYALALRQRFRLAVKRLGLATRHREDSPAGMAERALDLDCSGFVHPVADPRQMTLL